MGRLGLVDFSDKSIKGADVSPNCLAQRNGPFKAAHLLLSALCLALVVCDGELEVVDAGLGGRGPGGLCLLRVPKQEAREKNETGVGVTAAGAGGLDATAREMAVSSSAAESKNH